MIFIAVRQEVNTLDTLVVVHELEFAMQRVCKVVYEVVAPQSSLHVPCDVFVYRKDSLTS